MIFPRSRMLFIIELPNSELKKISFMLIDQQKILIRISGEGNVPLCVTPSVRNDTDSYLSSEHNHRIGDLTIYPHSILRQISLIF